MMAASLGGAQPGSTWPGLGALVLVWISWYTTPSRLSIQHIVEIRQQRISFSWFMILAMTTPPQAVKRMWLLHAGHLLHCRDRWDTEYYYHHQSH